MGGAEATANQALVVDENRELGQAPVRNLFFKYTFSTMVGMLAQAAMVMFEGFVIGNFLGEYGFACAAMLAPMEYVNLALGAGLSAGVCTVVGSRLGSGDELGARSAFNQGFLLTVLITLVISVLSFIFSEQLALFFGATEGILADSALALRIFVVWFPFEVTGQLLCAMLRIDEKPGIASWIMGISAVIAAAWLYCSVAMAGMGMVGVAHYYGASIGLWFVATAFFLSGRGTVLRLGEFSKMEMGVVRQILMIGLPSFLIQIVTTFYAIVINNTLGSYGGEAAETNIAVYSLINGYVLYVINMMWQCCQYGIQPIVAFNYGAKQWGRLKEALKWLVIGTMAIVAVASVLSIVFATPIYAFFTGGDAVLVPLAASVTLPMCALVFVGSISNVLSTYYQSVEKVGLSVFMGVVRYVVFAIPLILVLPNFMGINGVWTALPIADVLTGALALVFIARESRRLTALQAA